MKNATFLASLSQFVALRARLVKSDRTRRAAAFMAALVIATAGLVPAPVLAAKGTLWTTNTNCVTQDQNSYAIGDDVWLAGEGFDAGEYVWWIEEVPSTGVIDDGDISISENGTFCINAHTVGAGEDGNYKAFIGLTLEDKEKSDNYSVDGGEVDGDDEEEEEEEDPNDPVVTIRAHKIVCDSEEDLPNWGDAIGDPDIGPNTAADFLAQKPNCDPQEGWVFEWGPEGTTEPENSDTLIGPAGGDWQPMPATNAAGMTSVTLTAEQLANSTELWFREQLQEGYIPFTFHTNGDTDANNVSAEVYCHVDAYHYDNYDRIDNVALGNTYDCVGFNALEEVEVCDADLEMIVNGNFEAPEVTTESKWDVFQDGEVDGWSANWVNNHENPVRIELQEDGLSGWFAHNGEDGDSQWTEMDSDWDGPTGGISGEDGLIELTQELDTVPGRSYTVSLWTSPRPGLGVSENVTEVWWNGVLQDTIVEDGTANSNTVWTQHSFVYVADSETTMFALVGGGAANSLGAFVDDVSVKADCGGGQEPITSSISGVKFDDLNGNGLIDEGEEGLEGWTIYLDLNGDNEWNEGEPSQVTAADGSFSFEDLLPGPYIVREVAQDGWVQTSPGTGEDDEHDIVLGSTSATANFFNANVCNIDDQFGWYARYYDYEGEGENQHPDMNLDGSLWPDAGHGDPLSVIQSWGADWYDSDYLVDTEVDSNLGFGAFFPLDALGEDPVGSGHNYHFGVHWTGKVVVPADGDYSYTATSDDDLWIYLNGQLVNSNPGIHAPSSINGVMSLSATEDNIVDIFFAERHTVDSWMSFAFDGEQRISVTPWSEDCETPEDPGDDDSSTNGGGSGGSSTSGNIPDGDSGSTLSDEITDEDGQVAGDAIAETLPVTGASVLALLAIIAGAYLILAAMRREQVQE